MASTGQNISIYKGVDKVFNFAMSDPDPTTADAITWKAYSPGGAFVSKSLADDIATTSTNIAVTLDAADTASIPAGKYNHVLEFTNSAGKKEVVATGLFEILAKP